MHQKALMKIYEVTRSTSGQIGVLIKDDGNKNALLLRHCVLHSPDGMETGYSGSGPADLAASILADYFGITPERLISVWRKSWGEGDNLALKVIRLHQHFKSHFISPRTIDPGQSYEISGIEIESWLAKETYELSTA